MRLMDGPLVVNKSLWILEDDEDILRLYEEIFGFRYQTKFFSSLKKFEEEFRNISLNKIKAPSLILADLKLSDGNLLNFLHDLGRESTKICIPFFVVSAIDDIDVLRFCLKEGVVDYLVKPIKKNELLIKIENALYGMGHSQSLLDGAQKALNLDGVKIGNLTSKQMQVLSLFMQSPTRSVHRKDILKKVWGETTVHPKTVDVHLYNLRRKLGGHGFLIRAEGGGKWSLLPERVN